ncbi:TioE family transcriptional regulator [Streptomyces sp. NPDC018026]|uniref:TioE family transcriptional regulator n=1 Tax=Streptomyces sp. NPDC018026 TaxID=3365031 RepID=UPI0037A00C24
MVANLQNGGRLKPVDLARAHGLSAQAVRNYEADGILPAAARTAHGYRVYTTLHARALDAFLGLVAGHGHRTAAAVMRAVNEGAPDDALRLIDESHAQLLDDRRTLEAVEGALRDLVPEAAGGAPVAGGFIGALAGELGIRPATLRTWERAGLVRPRRDPVTGYRRYDEADVRDARLAHQLRRGGYPLERIASVLAQVRSAGGLEPLEAALREWHDRVFARGRAMVTGAAHLESYLRAREHQEEGKGAGEEGRKGKEGKEGKEGKATA